MTLIGYSKLKAAALVISFIAPSVGLALEYTLESEVEGDRTSLRVYLDERAEAEELLQLSQQLRETETATERVWIGFFLGEPSVGNSRAGQAWATSVCSGFLRFCDDLGLRIHRFTAREWDAFGHSGGMAPSDANVIGVWRVPDLLDVSIYEWEGTLYLFQNWYDGSGTPVEASMRSHPDGIKYYGAQITGSWVVYRSGLAQAWDEGRAAEEFLALPLQ